MFKFKAETIKRIKFEDLIVNVFYFLSAFLVLGFISDLLVPSLFGLYFNSAILALLWFISAVTLLLYVRK